MSYDRIDIHEHNEGGEILSIGIIILLVLFFPNRSYSFNRKNHK